MSSSDELFRVYHDLADGRKIYVTLRPYSQDRGPELVRLALAEGAVFLWNSHGRVASDPWVYSTALDHFGNRSHLVKSGEPGPFVAVVGVGFEPDSTPVDPHAYLFGGILVGGE